MLKELSCYCPLWHAEYFKNFLIVKTSAHTYRHTYAQTHRAGQVVVTVVVLVGRHLIIQVCCFCYCKKNVCRLCVSRSLSRTFYLSLFLSLSSSFPLCCACFIFIFKKQFATKTTMRMTANFGPVRESPVPCALSGWPACATKCPAATATTGERSEKKSEEKRNSRWSISNRTQREK